MRLLLDTHAVWRAAGEIGWPSGDWTPRRRRGATRQRRLIRGDRSEGGSWEARGACRFADEVGRMGIRGVLGLTAGHGLAVGGLPRHHWDPFDRLLVVQAQAERLTLMTGDQRILAYDVATIDAASDRRCPLR